MFNDGAKEKQTNKEKNRWTQGSEIVSLSTTTLSPGMPTDFNKSGIDLQSGLSYCVLFYDKDLKP